ncbi:hypothetical protein [Methylorubrum thiocyanatum]|uniref:hypothetical protein n=1 Tax=Methylorubrum thiocyanatum TaxID=47958 RepID=UPI00398C6181
MLMEAAREALAQGQWLEVRDDGFVRVVEVHACGCPSEGMLWIPPPPACGRTNVEPGSPATSGANIVKPARKHPTD